MEKQRIITSSSCCFGNEKKCRARLQPCRATLKGRPTENNKQEHYETTSTKTKKP
ncbi:hypothetical protein KSU1_C1082 [Candidatus Jettenia caeni]|uniref:Uncharacterized protein n=1 Tax=Candidatus Jettenia caeni TaxID=247490 RepID=I3ILT3_9BACT|nr:hypothetical protein KSU1_C1082 [Candidatus Jettenia caeni]